VTTASPVARCGRSDRLFAGLRLSPKIDATWHDSVHTLRPAPKWGDTMRTKGHLLTPMGAAIAWSAAVLGFSYAAFHIFNWVVF